MTTKYGWMIFYHTCIKNVEFPSGLFCHRTKYYWLKTVFHQLYAYVLLWPTTAARLLTWRSKDIFRRQFYVYGFPYLEVDYSQTTLYNSQLCSYSPSSRWRHRIETFSAFLTLCAGRGIHWSPVNSPHKDQWRSALMFSLICAWINGWVNNREAGDLRRHRIHYDVSIMVYWLPYVTVDYIQTTL